MFRNSPISMKKRLLLFRRAGLSCVVFMILFPDPAIGKDRPSIVKLGEATNGIRAEVELVSVQGRLTDIVVWVNHVDDTNVIANPDPFENLNKITELDWNYWMATNTFSGPIELRDSTGRILPSQKPHPSSFADYRGQEFPLFPDVSSLTAYPLTYSLKREHGLYFSRFKNGYSGPGIFPMPLFFAGPRTELVRFGLSGKETTRQLPTLYQRRFELEDYFDKKRPGEYTLTVWPKIYKRLTTNSDLCTRIDIPPVTVRFKWDSDEGK